MVINAVLTRDMIFIIMALVHCAQCTIQNYIKPEPHTMTNSGRIHPRFQESLQNPQTLVDQVYQAIHNSIITGRIHPGEPLPQVQLAEELGVSARTVREALSRLVSEGLAESEPHHSVRVNKFTVSDQEELYRMRAAIEGMAFEEAAARITRQELDHLKEILLLASQTTDPASTDSARHYNEDFHWTIIRASGKQQYIRILEQIWKVMFTYFEGRDQVEEYFDRREADISTHEGILEALENHDGKQARRMLEEHIRVTYEGQSHYLAEFLQSASGSENPE